MIASAPEFRIPSLTLRMQYRPAYLLAQLRINISVHRQSQSRILVLIVKIISQFTWQKRRGDYVKLLSTRPPIPTSASNALQRVWRRRCPTAAVIGWSIRCRCLGLELPWQRDVTSCRRHSMHIGLYNGVADKCQVRRHQSRPPAVVMGIRDIYTAYAVVAVTFTIGRPFEVNSLRG